MRIQEIVDVEAPPERVWDLTVDLGRWTTWNPTVRSVTLLDGGLVRPGFRARVEQPGQQPLTWTVTRADAPYEFVWETRTFGLHIRAIHHLEPVASITRVTLAIELGGPSAPFLGWLVSRASRRFVPLEAAALKATAERADAES